MFIKYDYEEEEKKSGLKIVLGLLFLILVFGLLTFYWFVPRGGVYFENVPAHSNFSLGVSASMQFYENMRFPEKKISYKIDDCSLQKTYNMKQAFEFIEGDTVLEFYEVLDDEDILIICDETREMNGGLFIAGEGGPTNITQGGEFNIIQHGQIRLIKESNCKNPNIAIHELLHVLGFEHSLNRNNIMYNITNCDQIIGPDIFELIDNVYVAESLPDLLIEKVSANLEGKYLSTNISIRNIGLKDASDSKLIIFVDGKQIEEVEIESMQMGYGRVLMFSNIWISQLRIDEIEYEIRTEFSELDKKNNKIEIKIGDD